MLSPNFFPYFFATIHVEMSNFVHVLPGCWSCYLMHFLWERIVPRADRNSHKCRTAFCPNPYRWVWRQTRRPHEWRYPCDGVQRWRILPVDKNIPYRVAWENRHGRMVDIDGVARVSVINLYILCIIHNHVSCTFIIYYLLFIVCEEKYKWTCQDVHSFDLIRKHYIIKFLFRNNIFRKEYRCMGYLGSASQSPEYF